MRAAALSLAALALLASCTTRTEYGPCIGAFDDPDPTLRYKVDVWNIAMGVIFVEMILPPIIVIADETRCPVGRKEASETSAPTAPTRDSP